jgi:chromosome partitioning protein
MFVKPALETLEAMKTIAIINQKGGTGKTTTAINLGSALAAMDKKVLLIDLDPQANLTYSFGIQPTKGDITEFLQGKQTLQTLLVNKEKISVLPSSTTLADVEVSLVNRLGRENILEERLSNIKGYDYIFIDCPPSLSILTINALNAADEVLIPLQMEILSLQGLAQLLKTIQEVKQVLNKKLRIRGIIALMYDSRRNLSKEVIEEIKKSTKERVFKTVIRECVKIAEAPSFAKSVLKYAPSSNGAKDYMELAKEFLKKGVNYGNRK